MKGWRVSWDDARGRDRADTADGDLVLRCVAYRTRTPPPLNIPPQPHLRFVDEPRRTMVLRTHHQMATKRHPPIRCRTHRPPSTNGSDTGTKTLNPSSATNRRPDPQQPHRLPTTNPNSSRVGRVARCQVPGARCRLPVAGRWSVVSGQWSVVSGQWSMLIVSSQAWFHHRPGEIDKCVSVAAHPAGETPVRDTRVRQHPQMPGQRSLPHQLQGT